MNQPINTHSTEAFRGKYIKSETDLDLMLKTDFGKFFIVKVEDLIRMIKLPVPPSRATTHTFIYLTEGEANMTIGSQSFTIYKDECLIVPAGQVYSFSKHDINKGYLCNFHNDFIIGKFAKNDLLKEFDFLNIWANPCIKLNPQCSIFIRQLLERILIDYVENGLSNIEIIQSYFIALLCEINIVQKPLTGVGQNASINLTNKFKELLFKHIREKHLVSDYASLLNVSPNHLNKVVKSVTDKSPTKWIDESIVLEAKVLLYQTSFSISEVASQIGIDDQSYFSRLFKKYEGISPFQFRKMIEVS
ncbi:AraC-like DNA-binding protein [Arcicella aurantiaca]|uniref:AraC-like DNA-binding protein n=1 Tax=Arcicella aurantiaca TaxID=591202 RepID=A0A316DW12_9BACT|nr:AraC family transcriptional regulator [Arcicella aurantiaca]PWK22115.1 AraC-like DNA-binding protein [Arcicella aurantiaca]